MQQFHTIQRPDGKGALYADLEPIEPRYGPAPQCPECQRYVGLLPWSAPFEAKIVTNQLTAPDLLIGIGGDLLISDQLLESLSRVFDFSIEPAVVHMPARLAAKNYHHISPIRLSYSIDEVRSSINPRWLAKCRRCLGAEFHAANRIILHAGSWMGEPLFTIDAAPGKIFITEHVSSLLSRFDTAGARIVPSEMVQID